VNPQNDKEGSGHVKSAVIGGMFVVAAACITGFFLILNTMVENGVIVFGMSNPSVQSTATVFESQAPALTDTPQVINTSNAPAEIASTATPASFGTITILGNSADGNLFTANQSGSYIIKYVDGAYSTFPISSQKLWQTSVRIYKNRPVAWNQNAIGEFDYNFLAFGEVDSKEQALSNAKGSSIIINLSQNDYIYLIAVDTKNSYADNPGEVILEILFIPQ
jgi:hypothetical protein